MAVATVVFGILSYFYQPIDTTEQPSQASENSTAVDVTVLDSFNGSHSTSDPVPVPFGDREVTEISRRDDS